MGESSQTQQILDVMFEILSRVHARDRVPSDRDELMSWARSQLCSCGIDVRPMGSSHAVLRESGPSAIDQAFSFILSDFEFLHAGHMDRMSRVKTFMDLVGLKIVKR